MEEAELSIQIKKTRKQIGYYEKKENWKTENGKNSQNFKPISQSMCS